MKLVISLVFSLSFLNLDGQKPVTYYYGDSTVSAKGFFIEDQPHGLWKNFYPNGNLKSVGKRFYGKLDSTWSFYFASGQVKMKIQYSKGIKNGYTYIYKIHDDYGHYLFQKKLYIDGVLHDKEFTYYPTGNVKSVTHFEEGEKSGYSIKFTKNKKPLQITEYRNNRPVSFQKVNQIKDSIKTGTWIKVNDQFKLQQETQYIKGKPVSVKENRADEKRVKYTIEGLNTTPKDSLFEGQFIQGKPVGRHVSFNKEGKPVKYILYDSLSRKIEKGQVKNYKIHGQVTGYFLNGNRRYNGSYRNNLRHGTWTFYYKNGQDVEQQGQYRFGKLHGQWVWFYKNGDTLRVENYRNGNKDGLYVSYDAYGNVLQKGIYINNLKQEHWIERRGSIIFEGSYFDGEPDGMWIGNYENGVKAFQGNYIRGKAHDKFIFYYPTGIKRRIEFYKFGQPFGHWQFYDREGILYKVKTYKKGESIFFKP